MLVKTKGICINFFVGWTAVFLCILIYLSINPYYGPSEVRLNLFYMSAILTIIGVAILSICIFDLRKLGYPKHYKFILTGIVFSFIIYLGICVITLYFFQTKYCSTEKTIPDTEIIQDASYNVVLPDGTSGEYTIRYDFKNDKIATTFLMKNGIKNEYTPSGSGGSLISVPVKDLTRDGEYSDAIISFSIIRAGKTVGPPLTVFDFIKCTAGISYFINQKLTNNKEKELSLSYSVYVPESKKITENISFSNKQAWVLHSNESLATHF